MGVFEDLTKPYRRIIEQLGETLEDYNVGAWALFRDQMATEISSQFIFGNGPKPDESLLAYSTPNIQRSNRLAKGLQSLDNSVPRAKFTYYTNEGPVNELDSRPKLPEPETDVLYGGSGSNIKIEEGAEAKFYGKRIIGIYDEGKKVGSDSIESGLGRGSYVGNVTNYKNGETLLSKTQNWFQGNKEDYITKRFATTISRFHTDFSQISNEELRTSVGLQAFSEEYGLSHGRNLRKLEPSEENGYLDPYCRVWTWHKQYSKLVKDTIRPFQENGKAIQLGKIGDDYNWSLFRSHEDGPFSAGDYRLQKYGVMYDNSENTNGLVNITPSMDESALTYSDQRNVSVEHCMFSIENLAWKGTYGDWGDATEENGLSREQKGPLGGRIMWFPPYDIKFNETSQANWQTNEFIGRGEPIYTYANTQRSGTLSFKLLIDHPAILDYWEKRSEHGNPEASGTDKLDSKEQMMLRFFAGCEILKAKQFSNEKTVNSQDSSNNKKTKPKEYAPSNGDKTLQFYVFFPNNYSGVSDRKSDIVEPIRYLINGVAANKYSLNEYIDYNETPLDLPSANLTKMTVWGESQQVGGYEMRPNLGISVVKSPTPNRHIVDIDYGGSKINMVKMLGSKADGSHKRAYYYRVDNTKDVTNQSFVSEEDYGAISYIDKDSYQLNSSGFLKVVRELGNNGYETYSLLEVFIALEKIDDTKAKEMFDGLYNESAVANLRKIFSGEDGKIKKIECEGRASIQGNNNSDSVNERRNKELAINRALTVQEWLKKYIKDQSVFTEPEGVVDDDTSYKNDDSNNEKAKINRRTLVTITYGGGEIDDASKGQVHINENNEISDNSVMVSNETKNGNIEGNDENNDGTVVENRPVRYDNEAQFFRKLKENEPFITKLLSERINNFDPVFHSMSPEGFNARLTFLNQCMRQGPTINSVDTNANNLAFGRPPVCVLRVGDFYNTKIIITSMTIDYDPFVWDLNQEGIGVMPMIANISLNFYFIGGSDLGGPIQRLQNATSFNYYANASVYDNRSEEIGYKEGEYNNFKAYQP